ncbi:MAG: hypothetical protein AAGG38_05955 [Planctomycetota bacterium]
MALTPPPEHPESPERSEHPEPSLVSPGESARGASAAAACQSPPTPPPAARQGRRRALYSLNVTVALVAALIVVVLLNVLADSQVRRLPAGAKSLLRYDLTATRSLTLAPQTRRVLAELDRDARITAVLRIDDKQSQDVADLLAQYADQSPRVSVETIHPDREIARLETFYRGLESRFTEETAPLRAAVTAGLAALSDLTDEIDSLQKQVAALAQDPALAEVELRRDLQLLANQLAAVFDTYAQVRATLRDAADQPLTPWSNARRDLRSALNKADAEVLSPFQRQMKQRANDRRAPLGVRDAMVRMERQIGQTRARLKTQTQALALPAETPRYDRLLAGLRQGQVVVVLLPGRERVLPVTDFFASPRGQDAAAPIFIGEDRLTGALVTLSAPQTPRVVFVRDTPQSLLGPRGGLGHIVSRLAAADFQLAEWTLGGGTASPATGPAAAAAASDPGAGAALPPLPAPGQPTVWVVPALSLDRTTQADRQQVAELLADRLAAGDGVMLNFAYDPEAQFRSADPLVELAKAWGIAPRMHELVLRENLGPDGRPRGDAVWLLDDWPADSPVADALAGRDVQLIAPSPLSLSPRPTLAARPVLTLEHPNAWVATGLTTPAQIAEASFAAESALGKAVIAAAAQQDPSLAGNLEVSPGRLMVFAEKHWLSDQQAARRLGNSELFINATYWLAGLDEAVAATPRTQDLRRIGPLSDTAALVYRVTLLAVLPAAALLLGLIVWLRRRRG